MLSYLGNPSIEQNYSSFLKIQNICKEKKEPPYQLSEKAWYSLKSNNNLNQQKARKSGFMQLEKNHINGTTSIKKVLWLWDGIIWEI